MINSKPVEKNLISKKIDSLFINLYSAFQFIVRFFKEAFVPPYEVKEIIKQCYEVGYKSLFLISLTGFITGLVFTKQSRPSLSEFGRYLLAAQPGGHRYYSRIGSLGYSLDLCRKSRIKYCCRIRFNESDGTDRRHGSFCGKPF